MKKLRARFKLWLSTEDIEGVFGDGKWRLLRSIESEGSLAAASEKPISNPPLTSKPVIFAPPPHTARKRNRASETADSQVSIGPTNPLSCSLVHS